MMKIPSFRDFHDLIETSLAARERHLFGSILVLTRYGSQDPSWIPRYAVISYNGKHR
jgi:hypothetical protein